MRVRIKEIHRLIRLHCETRAPQSAIAFRVVVLAAAIGFWPPWALPQSPVSEAVTTNPDSTPHVVLKKLAGAFYPGIANAANITGDVNIKVFVRADGSVESVVAVSGERILLMAAMESAKQSQFECRGGCSGLTEKSLIYTFRQLPAVADPCCCTASHVPPSNPKSTLSTQISEPEGHITIAVPPPCICPDTCTAAHVRAQSRFRSAKCLYLWKCGDHHYAIW